MLLKNIAVTKLFVIVIIITIIIILLVGKKLIKKRHQKYISNEEMENDGCRFCGKPATSERYPSSKIIAKMKKLDLEPSFAELQIIKVCDECKTIAGSFRSSKWNLLKDGG